MKTIKSVTIDSLDNLSSALFVNGASFTTPALIQSKVANYLRVAGSKKFIELYNEVATTKNYAKAIEILNIK